MDAPYTFTYKIAKMNKQDALTRLTAIENEAAELRKIIEQPDKITPEKRFWQLCEGLEMKIDHEKYPNSVFFFKGDACWFEYETKNSTLWCIWSNVWSVFEKEYSMNYTAVQALIKNQVEDHFKCKGVTPLDYLQLHILEVEDHFKCKGVTPDSKNQK